MHLRRWAFGFLAALSLSVPLVVAQAPAGPADIFARDRVLQIDVQMAPDVWREVRLSYRDATDETLSKIGDDAYEYRRGDVAIDGVRIARVGIRKKGFFGSVVSTRPSLKIKFDEYVDGQSYAGLDGLTLNNNNQDQTMVQQFLAYDLFARTGVPAPRASFAHVRVNGEDLGVYTHVEAINKSFLRRAFGNSNGVLYESYAGDFVEDRLYRIVEKSAGASKDRSALAALKDTLAATGPVSLSRVEALVDLDGFMRMWAAESLMGHWDGYSGNRNNYYLYANPTTRKLHFIPWGADQIFVDPGPLQAVAVPKSFKAAGVLCRRLWELPEIRERYRRVMAQILAGPWNEARLVSEMTALQVNLQPRTALLPETVRAASDRSRTFIDGRRAEVTTELAAPGLEWPKDAMAAGVQLTTPVPMVITGSFAAPWSAVAPTDPLSAGTGALDIQIEGKPRVAFERVAAYSVTNSQMGTAAGRERYKNVTVTGRAGTQTWTLVLTIDPFLLDSGARVLPIDHFAVNARITMVDGASPPRARRFGNVGELRIIEASPKEGGVIRGTFTIRGFEF